ncbi:hypothetical protein FRC17_006419 [Serendipita sp. 399]|nr:hypothetical protein FRC17_006419 [Serendipita sp. 399]
MLSSLPSRSRVRAATKENATYKPLTRPVGLFFGGTSGIGRAMAEELAHQTNGRAHIILLGRNEEAAKRIIAGFPHIEPSAFIPDHEASKYEFIPVDATSMSNVRDVTHQLLTNHGLEKVNFIVATTGFASLKSEREETSEGIDRKLACHFYGRFRFIHDLAPLVQKAAENGETVGVMTILAAGYGSQVDLNDLGLVKGYTLGKSTSDIVTYNDAVLERFAQVYPKTRLAHVYPGWVTTPRTSSYPGASVINSIFRFANLTPAECAQMLWWRMWTPEEPWRTGAHQINQRGDEIEHNPHVTKEVRNAVWEHALEMTRPA